MSRPTKIDRAALDSWIAAHPGWERDGSAIVKTFERPDFASGLGFVVRIGCLAEKRDHHPEVQLGWGRVRIAWSTHDAGGVTELDLAAAEATDAMAG
jgi:4a-hydroxytetrahydrobiopterin dehydratase